MIAAVEGANDTTAYHRVYLVLGRAIPPQRKLVVNGLGHSLAGLKQETSGRGQINAGT